MNTENVMYFLELLRRETTGHQAELNAMYQSAVEETASVIELNALLTECCYYQLTGEAMFRNGKTLLDNLYMGAIDFSQNLFEVEQMNETLKQEIDICRTLLRTPMPFSDTVTVLKKSEMARYMQALRQIAKACVHLTAVYGGIAPLLQLMWAESAGVQELIYAVNTKFLPLLNRVNRPAYTWVIRKKKLAGKALFGGEVFVLSFETHQRAEISCGFLTKEPIGTHAYLNVSAFETQALDVPYCWGVGNIVSWPLNDALHMLQQDIVTNARAPKQNECSRPLPTPMQCLATLTDNRPFCLTPDDLVSAMNQWHMGYDIQQKQKKKICLFCGQRLRGRKMVCEKHFETEFHR